MVLDITVINVIVEISVGSIPSDFGRGEDGSSIFNQTLGLSSAAGRHLATIAEKFSNTVEALIAYNNLEAPYEIEVGMILQIPLADYVAPEMGTDEPLPAEPSAEHDLETKEGNALEEDDANDDPTRAKRAHMCLQKF